MHSNFHFSLQFHISLKGLESRTLWLTVWHSDMFGRNDFLGEVMMALENKVFDDPSPRFYPLQERVSVILKNFSALSIFISSCVLDIFF